MSAADPVVDEYAKAAERYDEKWAFYLEATTRETLRRLPMSPGARVLDVGCGTGELLRRLRAKYPGAILAGLDPVPEMLAIAKDKLNGTEELKIGYADSLPWPSCSFDLVVSCNMFHYVRRPREALSEMRRVLGTGGQIVITDWCDDYLACWLCDRYLRLTSPAYYRSYSERQCRELVEASGFPNAAIDSYKISWLWGLMTASATRS